MLIEKNLADLIFVNFQIVGHTHNLLDQEFSVCSTAHRSASWIGSPASLRHLFSHCQRSIEKRPSVSRQIFVYYDWVRFLTPYLPSSADVKYYQYPHMFKFHNYRTKAIMQYKLFSTHQEWLPKPPGRLEDVQHDIFDRLILEVPIEAFSLVGGPAVFFAAMGVSKDKKGYEVFADTASTEAARAVDSVFPELQNLQNWHIESDRLVMEIEERGQLGSRQPFFSNSSRQKSVQMSEALRKSCDKNVGFICWIRQKLTLADIYTLAPSIISPVGNKDLDVDSPAFLMLPDKAPEGGAVITKGEFAQLSKQSFAAAHDIWACSKKILGDVNSGQIHVVDSSAFRDENFKKRILLKSEVEFYEYVGLRKDAWNVIKRLLVAIRASPPWELQPLAALRVDQAAQKLAGAQFAQGIVVAGQLAKKIAVSKQSDAPDGHEVLSRFGNSYEEKQRFEEGGEGYGSGRETKSEGSSCAFIYPMLYYFNYALTN